MRRIAVLVVLMLGIGTSAAWLAESASTQAGSGDQPVSSSDIWTPGLVIDRPARAASNQGLRAAVRTRPAGADETRFVQREASSLTIGGRPWSFIGVNIYNANSRWTCWYSMSAGNLGAAFAATGATAMRAWFFQSELLTPTSGGTWDWSPFDETIAAARSAGVRVIATLTDQWGSCEPGGQKDTEWYRTGYRTSRPAQLGDPAAPMPATYRDYVAAVVARYRDDPTIMAWQLVNEPETSTDGTCPADAPTVLQDFSRDMSSMIRTIDRNHLVSIGTIGSGQCGTGGDDYVALQRAGNFDWCELHDYYGTTAFGGDQWNGMSTRVTQCDQLGLPVVIGEAGIDPSAAGGTAARSVAFAAKIETARSRGIDGYLLWSWSDPPTSSDGSDQFAIGPGDPVLGVIEASARRWGS